MTPIESISSVFRKYVTFSGRAQRSEFWWFTLFTFVVSVILGLITAAVQPLSILEFIFFLAVLLPSLAVMVRRLHDTGRRAWWLMIYPAIILVWVIGFIVVIVAVVSDAERVRDRLELEMGRAVTEEEVVAIIELCSEIEDPDTLESELDRELCNEIRGIATNFIIFFIIGGLVSAAGVITLLILCALPGTVGPNRYGPDPLRPDLEMGGPGYAAPGHPYAPPSGGGGYGTPGYDAAPPYTLSEPEVEGGRYCSQCGAERQPDAQFCTVCGASFREGV